MDDWLNWSDHKIAPSFISFDDLLPSRYALSFIEQTSPNAYNVDVAFIALDAKNLGELVTNSYHTDFGDNVLPYFKSNTNQQIDIDSDSGDSSEDEDNQNEEHQRLQENDVAIVNKFMVPSVLRYLNC